jgi:ATP-dependent protease HslVU (ClpYQ) peptidase subunit
MTTILGTASNKYAVILSESQISDDDSFLSMPSDNIKIVKNGNWIIAGAGWSRPSDVLQYVAKWPTIPRLVVEEGQQSMTVWIIKNVIPKLVQALEKNKSIDLDKGTATISDAEFLIATYGQLFVLDSGFGVTPIKDYFVTGSGGKIALGAISIQKEIHQDHWETEHANFNRNAIATAIRYDLYSSGVIRGFRSDITGHIFPLVF